MKWVGCLNHNLQLYPMRLQVNLLLLYHTGFASLWPLAAVAGAETHYIYMNMIFYEYELGGVPQS
jgi:hypothetical protein